MNYNLYGDFWMIKIYTTPSCASCRKAKKWLKDHNIPFTEKNIFAFPLNKEDIMLMLKNSENGFEDIISTRSKYLTDNNIDVESLKTNELIDLIIKEPSILRRPIIVDDKRMQVGYNNDEIRVFIPSELREQLMCSNCDPCDFSEGLKKYYYEQVNLQK